MKKIRKSFKALLLFLIVIGAISFAYYKKVVDTPLKIEGPEVITVENGDTFYSILNKLSDEGKLRNTFLTKLYLKLSSSNLAVMQGKYMLVQEMSTKEMVQMLTTGDVYGEKEVTIPEGYTVDDIAEKLEKEEICSKEEFLEAVKTYALPDYIKKDSKKRYELEGYLFPDTYLFNDDVKPAEIVEAMVNRFEAVFNEVCKDLNKDISSDKVEEIVTVASMIEKEAVVSSDRELISSVIYNRLKVNMPLQIDATVIYAHGYHIPVLYNSDLEIDSPYNTYLYSGLPEGPISNPGKESIIAALSPASTNYIYYLLEKDNKHYFTDNYEDFLIKREELGYNMEE